MPTYSNEESEKELKKNKRYEIVSDYLKDWHDAGGPYACKYDYLTAALVGCNAQHETAHDEAHVLRKLGHFQVRLNVAEYLKVSGHRVAKLVMIVDVIEGDRLIAVYDYILWLAR